MCGSGRSPQSQQDTADTEVSVTWNDCHNAVLVIILSFVVIHVHLSMKKVPICRIKTFRN